MKPKTSALIIAVTAFACLVAGCAQYQKLTGVDPSTINSTAEQQAFTDLYNTAYNGSKATIADLTGPNAQNGADTVQAAWIASAESGGAQLVGQLLVDYGGPAVKALSQKVVTALANFKTPASLAAAKSTVASAIQNAVYQNPATAPVASTQVDVSVP